MLPTSQTPMSPLRKLVTNVATELVQLRRKSSNPMQPEALGSYALVSSALDFLNGELREEDEGVLTKVWGFETGITGSSFLEEKDAIAALTQGMASLRNLLRANPQC